MPKLVQTIIVIGGGLLQLPVILQAKKMGLQVIVTDYNPEAIGMKDADIPIVMSTRDIEGSVRVARIQNQVTPIFAVLTVGTDASMTVAAVASALNLPGIKFDDAEAATNKIKMRQRFLEHGVPSPPFIPVWSLKEAKEAFRNLKAPLVIKPADNMGARGVIRVDDRNELPDAFRFAKNASPSGELIIEEFMEGPELSIDSIIYNNEITITGVADRIIEFPPYFIETGHNMPSAKTPDLIIDACRVMRQGIEALGINIGAAKGDIKLTPEGPMIGELAARLSGGFMSAYTYPLHSGVNLMRAVIEVALGEEPGNLEPVQDRVAVERAVFAKPGIINRITGLEEALAVPGIDEIFLNLQPGDRVVEPRSNVDKAGHIIASGNSLEEVETAVRTCKERLRIDVLEETELSMESIRLAAREKLQKVCYACDFCDGLRCPTGVPGMGGIGTGDSFRRNIQALHNFRIVTRLIHNVHEPDTRTTFFERTLSLPVLIAPVTGSVTNMGGAIEELEYNRAVVRGSLNAGSITFVGDGASPEKYKIGLQALSECGGEAIPIFKPRADNGEIIKRIHAAEEAGALAVGIDIDAIVFKTMAMKQQAVAARNLNDLKKLVSSTSLPFILKGILNPEDARLAVEAGAKGIIISNHGGRVLDGMAGSMDVLESIVDEVRGEITILIDGGFRSGTDIVKALALGADLVCIGRPVAIAAVGMGTNGVSFYLQHLKEDLRRTMILTGFQDIPSIDGSIIRRLNQS